MIGKTLRDPEVQGNNEPSGRMNLKGQQKPDYLLSALEAEKRAKEYQEWVANDYELHQSGISLALLLSANCLLDNVIDTKRHAYARYNEECKYENH